MTSLLWASVIVNLRDFVDHSLETLSGFISIGTMIIGLHEFKKKKKEEADYRSPEGACQGQTMKRQGRPQEFQNAPCTPVWVCLSHGSTPSLLCAVLIARVPLQGRLGIEATFA